MNEYLSTIYTSYYTTPFGKKVWAFLNEHDNKIRMETASDLNHPAVEPLTILLVLEFGEYIRNDHIKQMMSDMVLQIMESRNFHLSSNNIKIHFGDLFDVGSNFSRN